MKKKLTLLFMAIITIVSLTGCGEGEVEVGNDNVMWLEDSGVRVEFSEVEFVSY